MIGSKSIFARRGIAKVLIPKFFIRSVWWENGFVVNTPETFAVKPDTKETLDKFVPTTATDLRSVELKERSSPLLCVNLVFVEIVATRCATYEKNSLEKFTFFDGTS